MQEDLDTVNSDPPRESQATAAKKDSFQEEAEEEDDIFSSDNKEKYLRLSDLIIAMLINYRRGYVQLEYILKVFEILVQG